MPVSVRKMGMAVKIAAGVLLAIIFFTFVSSCSSDRMNYRMTVVVETPEGIKTGSAVRELRWGSEPAILPSSGGRGCSQYGEAVIVDLGKRGVLFATMNTPGGDSYYACWIVNFFENHPDAAFGVKLILPYKKYPKFVYFRDLKDQNSVEYAVLRLEEFFGQGVRLKEVTVEKTTDPVTKGIVSSVLPWLTKDRAGGCEAMYLVPKKPCVDVSELRRYERK
jgi:hypothetical protein